MEKNVQAGMHSPERQESHSWSVQESIHESVHEQYEEPEADVDLEKDGNRPELSRTISGPPYSIFSPTAKMFIVISVSISSLISPFGATTFYPALNVLARELNVTPTLMNLSLTTYMVWPLVLKLWERTI